MNDFGFQSIMRLSCLNHEKQISIEDFIMRKITFLCLSAIMLTSVSGTALAQDSDYHSALSDNFIFGVSAFRSDNTFKIRAEDREIGGGNVDFGDSVGVDNSNTIANVQLRWKFGRERKWSIWGQYFSNDATGDATLEEDVEFDGINFREGSFVEAGVKFEVARVFVGRSFVKNEQHDFGVGAGIHNLDLSAFIGGEILFDDETTDYERADVGGSQILPNIGAWYSFSPARKWAIHGRVDWISANIGDYDGTMWNTNLGVNFQPWRHVGFDLSYLYFNIDLKGDKSDWIGGVDLTYSGPMLGVSVSW
jgi:hypothetical protein